MTPKKVAAVKEIIERLNSVDSYIFTDYRGASVGQMEEVRATLRSMGATYQVVKNRYLIRAFKECTKTQMLNHDHLIEILQGPTAIVMMTQNSHGALKYLFSIKKSHPILLKGAILDGILHNQQDVGTIATLPSREELIAQLLGVLQGTVRQFPSVLHQIVAKPVHLLRAIAESKDGSK